MINYFSLFFIFCNLLRHSRVTRNGFGKDKHTKADASEFIPMVERSGLNNTLDREAIKKLCEIDTPVSSNILHLVAKRPKNKAF